MLRGKQVTRGHDLTLYMNAHHLFSAAPYAYAIAFFDFIYDRKKIGFTCISFCDFSTLKVIFDVNFVVLHSLQLSYHKNYFQVVLNMIRVPIELSLPPPPPTRKWGWGIAQLILNLFIHIFIEL